MLSSDLNKYDKKHILNTIKKSNLSSKDPVNRYSEYELKNYLLNTTVKRFRFFKQWQVA